MWVCLFPKGSEVCWSLLLLLLLHARIQMEVGELSGMLTHMNACEQAQPVLHPCVLCRVASHSSASQVEETEPLVAGEQQKKRGRGE